MSDSRSFTIPAGQAIQSTPLSFFAKAVRVDNPTGQFYKIPTTQETVLPYSVGRVISFPSATQVAEMLPETPTGQTSNPKPGELVTAIWTEDASEAASGGYIGARLEPYDRGPQVSVSAFDSTLSTEHTNVLRWTYTVPANRLAIAAPALIRCVCFAPSTANDSTLTVRILLNGTALMSVIAFALEDSTNPVFVLQSYPVPLYLSVGDTVEARTTLNQEGFSGPTWSVFIGQERVEFDT